MHQFILSAGGAALVHASVGAQVQEQSSPSDQWTIRNQFFELNWKFVVRMDVVPCVFALLLTSLLLFMNEIYTT